MRLPRQFVLAAAAVLIGCESPLAPTERISATVQLATSVVSLGDSVPFVVQWTNRSRTKVELVAPIAYDVRMLAPDGTSAFVRAGRPSLDNLTADLVVNGQATQQWIGFWHPSSGRGEYMVEPGRFTSDGQRFIAVGPVRRFLVQ